MNVIRSTLARASVSTDDQDLVALMGFVLNSVNVSDRKGMWLLLTRYVQPRSTCMGIVATGVGILAVGADGLA